MHVALQQLASCMYILQGTVDNSFIYHTHQFLSYSPSFAQNSFHYRTNRSVASIHTFGGCFYRFYAQWNFCASFYLKKKRRRKKHGERKMGKEKEKNILHIHMSIVRSLGYTHIKYLSYRLLYCIGEVQRLGTLITFSPLDILIFKLMYLCVYRQIIVQYVFRTHICRKYSNYKHYIEYQYILQEYRVITRGCHSQWSNIRHSVKSVN